MLLTPGTSFDSPKASTASTPVGAGTSKAATFQLSGLGSTEASKNFVHVPSQRRMSPGRMGSAPILPAAEALVKTTAGGFTASRS